MSARSRGALLPAVLMGAALVAVGAAGCFGQGKVPAAGGGGTTGAGTGGAGVGGTGVRGSGGSGASGCASSLDCQAASDGNRICSVPTGQCVGCLTPADCAGGQDCVANRCYTPVACVNSLDCPAQAVCDRAAMRCVECLIDADCAASKRCAGGRCRARCASDNDCTPMGLLCDKALGLCAACVAHADCPAQSWCRQGECALDECVAGATRCQGGGISSCDSVGSRWVEPAACTSGRSCFEQGGAAMCQDWVCQPSTVACTPTGERVVSCSADGLVATVMNDCGAAAQVCVAATCRPVVCTAGARFCDGNQVKMCSAKGDSSSVYATCGAGQFCDAAATTCRAQICAPGQPACDGNVATTCNAQGSGYEGGRTDCAPGGQLCAQGACRTLMCIPNSYFCNAGAVWRCSADGLTSASYQPCSATQFCDAMQAMCRAQICTPNQPACDGNVATTCNTEGSGYAGLRTDCTTSGDVCVQGSCADLVCSPNAYFCEMGAVRRCAADGLGSTVFQTCSASQYCDAASATCKARICTAGQPACDGTVATTCNADGSGYTGGRSDCAAVNQFCDRGTCVAEMPRVDVIGVLSTSAAVTGRAKLNFFSVATSRTLRQIEQYMAIATAGGTPMNFLVFESATQTGTYTQIFSVTVTLPVATGYQSSGPMSVPLVAGRYYAIGVQWGSLSATYYWEQVAPTQTTSFGALINADTITTTTPPTSVPWPAAVATYRYNQRLTTGP